MTAGMSVTDIAASISLDSTPFMQGMKMVEQKFVDFAAIQAKAFEVALPDYQKQIQQNPVQFLQQQFPSVAESNFKQDARVFADAVIDDIDSARAEAQRIIDAAIASYQKHGFLPDQGMAHVELMKAQEGIIRQQLADEMVRRNQQELVRLRAHNADRLKEQRDAAEEESQVRAQADYQAYKQSLAAEERFGAVRKLIAERNAEEMVMAALRREQQASVANAKATAEAEIEIVQRSTALREDILARHGIEIDKRRKIALRESEERLSTERKIEATLNGQKAQYDQLYAFELKQKTQRAEFAKLLREAKTQGVSNENLTSAATEFKIGQRKDKEAFLSAQALKNANAQKQAQVEVLQVLAKQGNKQAEIRLLQVQQREEEQRFRENLEKSNATIAQREARLKDLRAGQKRRMDELVNPSDTVSIKDAREAESIINRLKTAQELHNERVTTYARLLKTVNVETGRTYLTTKQYNEAVKESERVMRASASGAGAYTGMLAQASFAAEDFIQGIAMGDLRSALLGASNNLTMVARGAFQAAEGVTVLGMGIKTFLGYLIGIPAAVAGLAIAFAEVNRAKRETLSLDEAIREAQQGYGIREINQQAKERARDEKLRIENIDTILQAEKDLKKQTEDQLKLRERLTMEETKRSATASRMIENLMGGPMAVTEFEQIMNNMKNSGDQASKDLALAMERNVSQATQALTSGDVNRSIQNLRELYERMNDIIYSRNRLEDVGSGLNAPFESLQYVINDPTALDSLEELFQAGVVFAGENDQALNDLRDKMTQVGMESLRIRKELEQATANEQQLEQRLEELRAEGLRLLNEQFKEKQRIAEQQRQENAAVIAAEAEALEQRRKRQLFDMTATEHQKEMLRIQEQMQEFMGPAGIVQGFAMPGVLGAPEMLGQLFQQGQAAGMQFLQAQATMLENEMAALRKSSSPEILGGMQQDAFQAQADAFKQMFAAANKQNPQLTALGQKLDAIRNAIQSGNILQVVGQ